MGKIGEQYQTADWKSEKHVPVIECPDEVKVDEIFSFTGTLGKEVAHPIPLSTTSAGFSFISNRRMINLLIRLEISNLTPTVNRLTVPIKGRFTPTLSIRRYESTNPAP